MNVLYEEEGEFKVGAVLSQSPRLLPGREPARPALQDQGRQRRAQLRAALGRGAARRSAQVRRRAWIPISCGNAARAPNSASQDLARDYVGREPAPVETAGVLLKLHAAPMYFYRRGRGRFQAAPEETLRLALAGVEKKKRLQEQIAQWAAQLARFECPPEIARAARRAALRARSRQARDQGAGAGLRADRADGGAPVRALRPAAATAMPTTSGASCTSSIRRARFPAHDAADAARRPAARARLRRSAWTTSAPPRSTTRSRSRACRRTSCASASTSPRRASRSRPARRWTRSRASACRPPTCRAQVHHASRGRDRAAVARRRAASGRRCRSTSTSARRTSRCAASIRSSSACASPPTCATPSIDALNAAFEGGRADGPLGLAFEEELHTLWQLALALEARRGKPSVNAGQPRLPVPRRSRAGWRSRRASAARRWTSWSPN